MKACRLLCALVLLSSFCFAQTTGIKLYGFRQSVAKGVHSSYETDEQGNKVNPKIEIHTNLFIYWAYPSNLNLYPVEIWVNGEQYSVKTSPAKTPVTIIYDNGKFAPETVILVPKTADTVTQLLISERLPAKSSEIKKSLAETNDLVVVYKLNGKFYSQTLKKIKALRMASMQ